MSSKPCTCGRIAIGLKVTDQRNWNPKCEEHKVGSLWWETVGKAEQDASNLRLRELYAQRNEARRKKVEE